MLTVQDVLQRPLFSKAEVVAGKNGVHRQVKWTHVLEIPFFDDTIFQGGELVLTTGFGFEWGDSSNTSFLLNLIERNASCLCIELGHHLEKVPQEMIEIANEHHFPIIIFKEFINFVEISQNLHSFFINTQHEKLVALDAISRKFHALSLTTHGLSNILKLLQEKTGAPILYLPLDGTPFAIPGLQNDFMEQLLQEIYKEQKQWETQLKDDSLVEWKTLNHTILLQPIGALDQIWAYLVMAVDRDADEFDYLILDRASLAISQDLLRKYYLDEKRLRLESTWLHDLLDQRIKNEEQAKEFMTLTSKQTNLNYRIAMIDIADVARPSALSLSDVENESAIYHYSLKIRSGFEKHSFTPYITSIRNQIIVLAIDLGAAASSKLRFSKVVDTLTDSEVNPIRIGIGRQYNQLLAAHMSYREAQSALNYRSLSTSAFYEDLGIFRLIQLIHHDQDTAHFIEDYLSPLITYDQDYGTDLVLTLTTYFECDRSKKITAENLHIVRQTLYHRFKKINDVLTFDFDAPENRLNVEMALKVYQLMQQSGGGM